jgi:hypothetical protein
LRTPLLRELLVNLLKNVVEASLVVTEARLLLLSFQRLFQVPRKEVFWVLDGISQERHRTWTGRSRRRYCVFNGPHGWERVIHPQDVVF